MRDKNDMREYKNKFIFGTKMYGFYRHELYRLMYKSGERTFVHRRLKMCVVRGKIGYVLGEKRVFRTKEQICKLAEIERF